MVNEYIKKYKEEIKRCINDLKHKDTFYKQVPNLLTFSRVIGTIPINILFFTGNVIPAILLTGLILSTDFFDGKIARKWNIQSKFGADLDALSDKFMFLGLSLPLIVNNPMLIINFLLEGVISIINVSGRMNGLDTKTTYAGKVKTWFLSGTLVSGYLVHFLKLNPALFAILSSMTIGSQIITINSYIKEYKSMKRAKMYEELFTENDIEEDIELSENLERERKKQEEIKQNVSNSLISDERLIEKNSRTKPKMRIRKK